MWKRYGHDGRLVAPRTQTLLGAALLSLGTSVANAQFAQIDLEGESSNQFLTAVMLSRMNIPNSKSGNFRIYQTCGSGVSGDFYALIGRTEENRKLDVPSCASVVCSGSNCPPPAINPDFGLIFMQNADTAFRISARIPYSRGDLLNSQDSLTRDEMGGLLPRQFLTRLQPSDTGQLEIRWDVGDNRSRIRCRVVGVQTTGTDDKVWQRFESAKTTSHSPFWNASVAIDEMMMRYIASGTATGQLLKSSGVPNGNLDSLSFKDSGLAIFVSVLPPGFQTAVSLQAQFSGSPIVLREVAFRPPTISCAGDAGQQLSCITNRARLRTAGEFAAKDATTRFKGELFQPLSPMRPVAVNFLNVPTNVSVGISDAQMIDGLLRFTGVVFWKTVK